MKIKSIYKDDQNRYIIRYSDGTMKTVTINEAQEESALNKIDIGESEFVESQEIEIDWSDGFKEPSEDEKREIRNNKSLEYYHSHKEYYSNRYKQRKAAK